MSKITPVKLTLEDFPEQRKWIAPLFSILNSIFGELVRGFNNGVTVEDNLFQEIKEIKWTNSTSEYPVKFRTKFAVAPKGLVPIYLYNNTSGAYSALSPWIVWSYVDGTILISSVVGLTSDSQYTMRIQVIYG